MAIVNGTARNAANEVIEGSVVTAELVSTDAESPGYINGGDVVAFSKVARSADDGTFSLDLIANEDITPDGTYYRITMTLPGERLEKRFTIVVPAGGPYDIEDLLVSTPESPEPTYVESSTFADHVGDASMHPSNLDDLDDVNAPTPSDGQRLAWDDATNRWVPVTPVDTGAETLPELSDVDDTATPTSGHYLRGDGTDWDNSAILEADIPATIARDSEVATAVGTEATARANADSSEATARANADSAHAALTQNVHGIADTSLLDTIAARVAAINALLAGANSWADVQTFLDEVIVSADGSAGPSLHLDHLTPRLIVGLLSDTHWRMLYNRLSAVNGATGDDYFHLDYNGVLEWGDGDGPVDTYLERSGPNALGTGGSFDADALTEGGVPVLRRDQLGDGVLWDGTEVDLDSTVIPKRWAFAPYASNPIVPLSGSETAVTWSDVLKVGSTYHMYYTYDPTGGLLAGTLSIGHATSSDGKTWTKDTANNPMLSPGSAGAWDDRGVGVPCVWKEGSTWYMLYRGQPITPPLADKTGLATSSDGIIWTKHGSNPVLTPGGGGAWDEYGAEMAPGSVIKVGSTYYGFYEAPVGDALPARAVGVVTSTDLVTWTKDAANNPILTGGRFCPSVFKVDEFYYLICPHYTSGSDYVEFELYRDTAPTFYPASRKFLGVIKRTSASGWDSHDMDTPVLLTDDITRSTRAASNDELWIYYSGEVGGSWRQGLLIGYDAIDLETFPNAEGVGFQATGNVAATNVQAAIAELDTEKVDKSTYDANSLVKADSDNTPTVLTVAEQTLVGRITGGSIDDLSVAQVKTLLAYIAANITNTPAGNIAATDVQAAINELDSEKVPTSDPLQWGFPMTFEAALRQGTTTLATSNNCNFYRVRGGGTISKIALVVGVSSGNISVAVCTGPTGRNNPNTRVQSSGAVACPASGYAEVALGASVAVSPQTGWFAISADNTTATFDRVAAPNANNDIGLGMSAIQTSAHPVPSPPAPTAAETASFLLVGVA